MADFDQLMLATFQALSNNGEFRGADYFIGTLLTQKSLEWLYENEFRLVCNRESKQFYDSSAIRSITVGEKMTAPKLKKLISVLKGNHTIQCKLYKAYINIETFELERVFLCELGKA